MFSHTTLRPYPKPIIKLESILTNFVAKNLPIVLAAIAKLPRYVFVISNTPCDIYGDPCPSMDYELRLKYLDRNARGEFFKTFSPLYDAIRKAKYSRVFRTRLWIRRMFDLMITSPIRMKTRLFRKPVKLEYMHIDMPGIY